LYNTGLWAEPGSLVYWVMASYEIGYLSSLLLMYAFVWIRTPKLMNWLNGWNPIDQLIAAEFHLSCVSNNLEFSYNIIYKRLKRYVTIFIFVEIIAGTLLLQLSWDWNYPLYVVSIITISYLPNLSILAEDTTVVLSYSVMELAFRTVCPNLNISFVVTDHACN